MCGLAGFFGGAADRNPEYLRARLQSAADVLEHRGPNDGHWWLGKECGLAHRRLAILDPSPRGRQPMVSRSSRFVIGYNGEIYNFRELARELSIEAETGSDTEILLEGFERIGPSLLARLNGIFAFAIVDTQERVAWLARDRFGVKPLYLAEHAGGLLFGSEIKAILALAPDFIPRLAVGSLHEWAWYGNALGGRTMFEGIEEVEPGGLVRVDLASGDVQRNTFWSIAGQRENSPDLAHRSDTALAEDVARTLEQAVARQLVSDVPVGVFLSGGIDSSAITAFASRHHPDTLQTFSVAFDYDRDGSELARARSVAEKFGTVHHEIDIAVAKNPDAVEQLIASHDLPFSDAANIPLMLLSERVAPTHKVILQGDGGDELFGGYSRYRTIPRLGRWKGAAILARPFLALLSETVRGGRARRYIEALGASDEAELVALLLTVERRSKPPAAIFGTDIRQMIAGDDPFARYREVMDQFAGLPLADRLFFTDMSIILPDIFLPKVDRSTMARGIEVRVPFLDNDLANLSIAIPAARKIPGGEQKGLLKRALDGIVPDDVLYGPKRGFGVPFGNWVTGTLADRMDAAVVAANDRIPGLLDPGYLRRLRDEHRAGRSDNGFILWKAFNLSLWVERFDVTMPKQ